MPDNLRESATPPRRYTPTPIFRLAAALFVLGSLWLGSRVWQQPNILDIIMFVGVSIIAVFMVLGSFASAEFDGRTLTYRSPLRPTHRIDIGQIFHVEMSGRRTQALIIGYHPRDANGRIETENVVFINLAPLQDQWELLEALGGETIETGVEEDDGRDP